MPPNTREFRAEITKTQVMHPGMKLKDRLKLKYQPGTSFSSSSTSNSHQVQGSGESPFKNGANLTQESCPFLDNGKRFKQESSDPQLLKSPSKQGGKREVLGTVTNLHHKKMKKELNSAVFSKTKNSEMCSKMSSANLDELELLHEHEALFDKFVKECGVTTNYAKTRNIMIKSGYKSWTDLVPSLKMTEHTLVECVICSDLCSVMLDKSQASHNKINKIQI
ncbi:uncharacterized protein MELLADRAFT_92745 [Melampsora larici-populina 98AG31]|uniref:Uncharacterized protein n=1 Tax=Melampsora larici-populina (strain 98AG31 / pathotype 3-4-7) TaxID=747676 RepID=F4S2L3_MELLP|nr:uncharacterized protein MELLADRAFT_92745 [Melampsora larici-populina 98AG31]EGG01024.1 hypothetical protein MELLADRAFT_92745 [Melampsora larici-populina 98AG31]